MRKAGGLLATLAAAALLGVVVLNALGADEGESDAEKGTAKANRTGGDREPDTGRDRGSAARALTPGSLAGSGELSLVRGSSKRAGAGPLKRFTV